MNIRASLIAALFLSSATVPGQQPTPAKPAPAGQNPAPAAKSADPAKQDPAKQDPTKQDPSKEGAKPAASNPKLEQLVAPIALYDDGLLAQVLMASTYPIEIVEAARWQEKNASLKGDALEKAMKDLEWDPSVKSIVGIPSVLKRMNENLEWTQDLGDAFLADQSGLMAVVQTMRRKAFEAGSLKTSEQQKVEQRDDQVIVIEAADPEVVYVPTYYPTAVYGGWYYPSYYYPAMYPPYRPVYPAFTFAVGVAWGAAIWGNCNWGGGNNNNNINIDIDRENNFNGRTDNRPASRTRNTNNKWQHDPSHRKGVGYRDKATASQFGGNGASNRVSRDQARGYGSSAGTRPAARTGAGTGAGARPGTGSAGATNRSGTSTRPSATTRPSSSGQRSSGFSGANSPSTTRAASSRGATSRGSSSAGSRSGGGSRGGGGGRGGGGRGR